MSAYPHELLIGSNSAGAYQHLYDPARAQRGVMPLPSLTMSVAGGVEPIHKPIGSSETTPLLPSHRTQLWETVASVESTD